MWLLQALAEQRVAVLPQAAHWLGVSEPTAARRLRKLRAAGLVEHRRVFSSGAPMVRITGRGLKAIGSDLGRPGQKLDEYRHDVGVGWVWTAAREGVFGDLAEIHSERAMRSHDARVDRLPEMERMLGGKETELRGVGSGLVTVGRSERHYPDLLLRSRAGHSIAVELELTSKGRNRLDRVMQAYACDTRIDAVLYLVPDASLATKVRDAAVRAGIEDMVHVRRISPRGIGGVPGRQAAPVMAPSAARARKSERGAAAAR